MQGREVNPELNEDRANVALASVNVTYAGQNGDLPDAVSAFASDAEVLRWVREALSTGGVKGIEAQQRVDLRDFVVDRFAATAEVPYVRLMVRPKTPFGWAGSRPRKTAPTRVGSGR